MILFMSPLSGRIRLRPRHLHLRVHQVARFVIRARHVAFHACPHVEIVSRQRVFGRHGFTFSSAHGLDRRADVVGLYRYRPLEPAALDRRNVNGVDDSRFGVLFRGDELHRVGGADFLGNLQSQSALAI